jgi:hypothetical protein
MDMREKTISDKRQNPVITECFRHDLDRWVWYGVASGIYHLQAFLSLSNPILSLLYILFRYKHVVDETGVARHVHMEPG